MRQYCDNVEDSDAFDLWPGDELVDANHVVYVMTSTGQLVQKDEYNEERE